MWNIQGVQNIRELTALLDEVHMSLAVNIAKIDLQKEAIITDDESIKYIENGEIKSFTKEEQKHISKKAKAELKKLQMTGTSAYIDID